MIRKAFNFFFGSLLSRVGGVLREQVMGYRFGATPAVSEFILSFRFINIFRRIFGEGGLSQGFMPHYEQLRLHSSKQADCFFRDLVWTIVSILFPLTLFFEYFYFQTLLGAMFIGVIFIVLYAIFMGFLQCHGVYFLPALAPGLCNVMWILSCFLTLEMEQKEALMWVCYSISFAFFLQWLFLVPSTYRRLSLNIREWLLVRPFSPEVRIMLLPMVFSFIGLGASQVNGLVDVCVAKYVSDLGPAHLNYALKLGLAPIALCAVAISSASAPELARAFQGGLERQFQAIAVKGMELILTCLVPCTLFFIFFSEPFVNLFFGRGAITSEDIIQIGSVLRWYAVGIIPSALILLLAPSFYAKKDFKTPTIATLLGVAVNSVLSLFFVFSLSYGVPSVALATGISAWFQFAYLVYQLKLWVPLPVWTPHLVRVISFAFFFYLIEGIAPQPLLGYPRELKNQIWLLVEQSWVPLFLWLSLEGLTRWISRGIFLLKTEQREEV